MRSYLSLITISAKVHRRQNHMTLLCIIFSVFMVTAVFSMAEMGARMEQARLAEKHGDLSLVTLFDSTLGSTLLGTAGFLFLLILAAGVLMIASSLNSSVAQRTRFFGMMRCIGMSKAQIVRFVRLEALNWCKTAVPIGLALGIAATWALCAVLRFLVREEFSRIPLFGISALGIFSGILVGVVAVLIAAGAPAKRASRVSPVTAASGNAEDLPELHGGVRLAFFRVETALGIHHATAARKNLVLMTGSFALSILLFLSFSVLVDFVNHLMPQSVAASDIDLVGADGSGIAPEVARALQEIEGVEQVYGRRSSFDLPVQGVGGTQLPAAADLVSFDDFDLDCLAKDHLIKRGSELSRIYGDSNYVLATWDPDCRWEMGDTVWVNGQKVQIAGLLNCDPFSADGLTHGKITLIMSGETYTRLTGETEYSLLMIQTAPDMPEESMDAIRRTAGAGCTVTDKRDQSTAGTYLAFVACVYGFLGVIALVTLLNIINSISMSVSARIRQYGAMRAVGMEPRQISRMILAESMTYALWGCAVGCAAGLPVHQALYGFLITDHFPYAVWKFPLLSVAVILLFVLTAALLAALGPAKRIRTLSITETINEL